MNSLRFDIPPSSAFPQDYPAQSYPDRVPAGAVPATLVTNDEIRAMGLDPVKVRRMEDDLKLEGMGLGFSIALPGIIAGAGKIVGAIKGGGKVISSPTNPCPGTPSELASNVARAIQSGDPEASSLISELQGHGEFKKRGPEVGASMATPMDQAKALLWQAWGGADCKVGNWEGRAQSRIRSLAAKFPAVKPLPREHLPQPITTMPVHRPPRYVPPALPPPSALPPAGAIPTPGIQPIDEESFLDKIKRIFERVAPVVPTVVDEITRPAPAPLPPQIITVPGQPVPAPAMKQAGMPAWLIPALAFGAVMMLRK